MNLLRALCLLAAVLPLPPASAASYTVQPGDTLFSLARRFGTTVAALQALNHLSSSGLRAGQTLTLPDAPGGGSLGQVAGVQVQAPTALRPGDAFTLRFTGENLTDLRVRFLSETGEDVRQPAEVLTPQPAPGGAAVLGRVVLGARSAEVRYEVTGVTGVTGGDAKLSGRIPVRPDSRQRVQNIFIAARTLKAATAQERAKENKLLEDAYARRTPRQWTEPFALPAQARVVSSVFGSARRYQQGGEVFYHYGSDLIAPTGTPVRATNAGTVVVAQFTAVRGGLVVIDHGLGVVSAYYHQSKLLVKPGDVVTRGQLIGEVGSLGFSTAPHLHWEMRVRGEATDPLAWVGKVFP